MTEVRSAFCRRAATFPRRCHGDRMVTFGHFDGRHRLPKRWLAGRDGLAVIAWKAAFMIESIMYFGIGFLFAALSVLIVVPLVHGRAVRLTTRRLEGAIPSSMTEIRAHKDLLRAEFAMTTRDLEAKIEQLKTEKANQLTELGKKGDAINRLKIDLGVLRDQLRAAEEKFEAKATALDDAEHALSDRESKLTTVLGELDERSALADVQKIEIIALKTQVEALKERLDLASNELQAVEDRRDADRIELKAATQKLMEERGKFENFHHRVAELVKQVVTQTTEDKILARRAQDDLENRLVEQSRLLNEREFELKHLREEIEIARKAESDLRVAIIEIDGRDKTATQNLEAEKAKLQAALDRANGERMRLAHELASLKRQGKEARAA